ncbi:MAG: DUF1345 domain-containing protein [Sphingomicrobium sp.]
MAKRFSIGNRVAPARFVIFFAMLFVSVGVAAMIAPWWRSVMLGFDLSALVFMASCIKLYDDEAGEMRDVAEANDANRAVLLFLAFALGIVILVAVGSEMASGKSTGPLDIAITIATLLIAWFFGNTVYALHYAHLFYTADDGGKDRAGIVFPGTGKTPAFSDFVYFAFAIGAALSTSDTNITSPHIRKVVTAHSIVAFIFNVGVFALTVNMLAGKG